MGLLSQGSPLNWEETKKYADHIRKHGIIQFLNIYNKVKERQKDVLKWGDEVRNERKRGKCCCCCCLLMPFDLSVMIAVVALFLIFLHSLQEKRFNSSKSATLFGYLHGHGVLSLYIAVHNVNMLVDWSNLLFLELLG